MNDDAHTPRMSDELMQSVREINEQYQETWDNLPAHVRVRILAQRMDQIDPDELTEEQARELKQETEKALEDFEEALKPAIRTLAEMHNDVMEYVAAQLAEENND